MENAELVFEQTKPGRLDKLQALLCADPVLANSRNIDGISLLLLAIYYRNEAAIHLIRSCLTEIDEFEAACLGELEVIQNKLINNSLLLNSYSPDGFTLLGYACFFGQELVAEYLISTGADVNMASANDFKVSPLHSACAISNYQLTQMLLQNGADVDARQQGGFTALHSATMNHAEDIQELLLQYGADRYATDNEGKMPFDY